MQPAAFAIFLVMNADPLARIYRWLEYLSFGPFLTLSRDYYLHELAESKRILILGGGDGRILPKLLRINTQAQIDWIDNSARMRALARSRIPPIDQSRVIFHATDLLRWTPSPSAYDAIVTHYVLDCFSTGELKKLLPQLIAGITPQARWVIAEFQIPTHAFLRPLMRLLVALMYQLFGWTTGLRNQRLPDYEPLLRAQSLVCRHRHSWLGGFVTAQLWMRE